MDRSSSRTSNRNREVIIEPSLNTPWEFWIDVGGTFTDCIAVAPDGGLRRHKLLSSGVTKGSVGEGSSAHQIFDVARRGDPAHFWDDFQLTLLGHDDNPSHGMRVTRFESSTGCLTLEKPLSGPLPADAHYELASLEEAPIVGIRYLLGLPLAQPVPALRLRLGTTRGTNALLNRNGAKTALVTSTGFGDLLKIGYQDRPRLFELSVRKPQLLAVTSLEIDERVTATGQVLHSPDPMILQEQLQTLRTAGIESLAICLMHADRYPDHERLVEQIAQEVGFVHISRSSEVAPLVKIVARAETTVVDAYLTPLMSGYLRQLKTSLPGSSLRMMTSSGGLVSGDVFHGHQSILSGPAGGAIGFAKVAEAAGFTRAIGLDMGGTSCDVSRYDGRFELEYETEKAGIRLMTPTMPIETVAAGGGSICRFDGIKLVVGPTSAGADPGPACYGRGGPLCVTDVNFYLGRLLADRFPFPLDRAATKKRLVQLARQVEKTTKQSTSCEQLAAGLVQITNANMARAIRSVSVAQGAVPQHYILVAFGGAAAQHVCAVAGELGITQALYHPQASILSAYGIGLANVVRHQVEGIYRSAEKINRETLEALFQQLSAPLVSEVQAEGIAAVHIRVLRFLDLRYQGTDIPLTIPYQVPAEQPPAEQPPAEQGPQALQQPFWLQLFEQQHRKRYGYLPEGRAVEVVAARVEVLGKTEQVLPRSERATMRRVTSPHRKRAYFTGQIQEVPWFERSDLQVGDRLEGPALIVDTLSTVVLESAWRADVLTGGELLLTHETKKTIPSKPTILRSQQTPTPTASPPAAVMLEIFNNHLAGIADQMGHVLRRTAGSVNVKERLDYSCAIFTAEGRLVANAPHVPVHLGAMGATVRGLLAQNDSIQPGDVLLTNDPYQGGSHLPDVTVVMPVHAHGSEAAGSNQRTFFTACRAHHAEIGGVRPGSMPPLSTKLSEEGVLISNFFLVQGGHSREEELQKLLATAPYPSRARAENLADIRAQVAACQLGANHLHQLVDRYTLPVIQENMRHIQFAAQRKVRDALTKLPPGKYRFIDALETASGNSVPIQVEVTIQHQAELPAAQFDFTGTGPVQAGNLNANPAIVTAAILYVLRLLIDEEIPLNEGVLDAIRIILPPCLLNPSPGDSSDSTPAVAAGNVETSQRLVDVLLGALGLAGASQGTMNNVLFGDESFGYYETICGGSGATAEYPGADAVQCHMTNTRATDPEVLERRLPVRLLEQSIRKGSGGAGRHRGGDGVVRKLQFLQSVELSLITQRRGPHPPYGMAGGSPGSLGENRLIRADGTSHRLSGICECSIKPGDILVIETPGGGGYGRVVLPKPGE